MLAVVAMAAFSCAKVSEDIDNVPKDESSSKTKVITITAEPDDDVLPDTKTSLSGVSIIWNDLDKVAGYDTVHDKVISDVTTVTDEGKKATFSFEAPLETESFYYLVYPATACGAGDDSEVEVTVPTNQKATANSFAPGANIAFAEVPTDVSKVKFMNIGGLISFIIHNDNISSVEFSANEVMTGIGSVDVNTGVATPGAGNKKVIVNGGLTNGNTYYAVVYPNTYTGLKMTITDNTGRIATYSNPNDLIVSRNANLFIAELTIPDGKWVTPSKGKEYMFQFNGTKQFDDWGDNVVQNSMTWTLNKVTVDNTANPGSWDGSSRGQQLGTSSNKITTVSLVGVNYADYCESSTAIGIKEVHVKAGAKNGTTITATVSVGGVAMSAKTSGSDSYTAASTVPGTMTFSSASLLTGDIEITYTLDIPGALYINDITINPDSRTPQSLSFPQAGYSVDLEVGSFDSPVLSGAETTVTYSSDNTSVATVDPSTGLVTLVSAGVANIKATAEADETYKEGSATYALNVITPSSIASVLAASNGDEVYTSGVVSQINGKGFILTDGTNNVFVFNDGEVDVVAGQAVKVRGARGIYNGIPQITSPDITKGATGQSVVRTALTVITNANATGHSNSTYISLSGKLSFSGSYYNVSIDGSSTQGSLYQVSGTEAYTAGTLSSLVGSSVIVTGYIVGSTSSYLSIAVVDIVIDTITPTLSTTPESGETIEWADDKYGDENAETITVVLNGAASGYTVSYTDTAGDWSVADNGSGTITVYPFAANASTTTDKTLAITITHKDNGELTSVINLKQKKIGGTTWARVTSVATLLAGGTFIIGYESTANSGIIVPMANSGSASTSAAGFMYSGATATSGGSETINMATVETTSSYEVQMGESSEVDGAIYIKIGDNYLGNTNTKNNCKLFTSQASTTSFKPTLGSNDTFTLEIEANTGEKTNYKYLKYNTGSPRFAVYSTTPDKIVIYKKN